MNKRTKRYGRTLSLLAAALLGASPAAHALGPIDAEAGVVWWAHDVDRGALGDADADGAGAYAEIWWNEGWGIGAEYYESDPDGGGLSDTSMLSVDLKKRIFSPTENNFLAIGAGWQDLELSGGGSTDGLRLVAEARVGLGVLFGYGHYAWMPDLGDTGAFRDIDGTEYQVGVSFTPFPFLNVRAGYRVFDIDYRGGSQKSDGYLIGAAIHF